MMCSPFAITDSLYVFQWFLYFTILSSGRNPLPAYYNQHFAKVWKWSAVKTKEIEALIAKVMRIEGVLPPSEEEKVVA